MNTSSDAVFGQHCSRSKTLLCLGAGPWIRAAPRSEHRSHWDHRFFIFSGAVFAVDSCAAFNLQFQSFSCGSCTSDSVLQIFMSLVVWNPQRDQRDEQFYQISIFLLDQRFQFTIVGLVDLARSLQFASRVIYCSHLLRGHCDLLDCIRHGLKPLFCAQ